jgi:hypothetical protein
VLTLHHFLTRGLSQFVTLPLWWYGRGLGLVVKRLLMREHLELRQINVWAWLKNFWVPMFHDYTIIGRGLSVVFRFFIIIFKVIQLIIGFIVRLILLAAWLITPLFFVWGIINYIG